MIISRTPLRVSFAGGGSDLPDFYRKHGGAVISTAVNRYVYVTANRKFDNGIRIAYSKTEEVKSVHEIEHKLVRAVLDQVGISGGVEITTVADIPSRGTGLGSSSSFTVALLHALYAFSGTHVSKARLAEESCYLEIEACKEPIGKQDQYAAAFGGLNLIEFHPDDSVKVSPVICLPETADRLRNNLLLLYTGLTRSASEVLWEQREIVRADVSKQSVLRQMVKLCYELKSELERNNLDAFGEILDANWKLKRSLTHKISNSAIDDWYSIARKQGATGGKLLGAGAGGFLLIYAAAEDHDRICHALPNLRPVKIDFDRHGSQIIFYNPPEKEFTPTPLLELRAKAG